MCFLVLNSSRDIMFLTYIPVVACKRRVPLMRSILLCEYPTVICFTVDDLDCFRLGLPQIMLQGSFLNTRTHFCWAYTKK